MSCCCPTQADVRHLSVHDCFERGLASRRLPALPVTGARISGANGLWVQFSLQIDAAALLTEIRFDASTCTTLIAYCQALVDIYREQTPQQALQSGSRSLVAALHGVPAAKYDRAILAIAAFRAPLIDLRVNSRADLRVNPQWENPHESRLHLRDPETHSVVRARTHDSAAA